LARVTLADLYRQGRRILMASAELKAALKKIDLATDNIAADITRLKERIQPGMTEAEVAEVQALAEALVAKLEGIAADPDNPDPAA
jgi:ribosome-associated translation inhibitor RaiA